MSQNHTPGPWEAEHGADSYFYVTHDGGLESRNVDADARLIAAAPDLLEACLAAQEASDLSDACKDLDSIPKHIMDNAAQLFDRARRLRAAAIAKASSS